MKWLPALLLFIPLIISIPMNKIRRPGVSRIINGKIAAPYQYPWFALLITTTVNIKKACGASVLSIWYVISAQHCIYKVPFKQIQVLTGIHEWKLGKEKYRQYRNVLNIFIYQDPKGRISDICMIKVDQPFQQTAKFRPIDLPFKKAWHPRDNQKCIFTGIGLIVENPPIFPKYLQVIDLSIINRNQCLQYNTLKEFEICAGKQNSGPCDGDSGGGLVCKDERNMMVLTGVESGLIAGAPCGSLKYPGIFVRVSYFLGWIKQTLKI